MLRIVGTLENMIKEGCGNKSALLILSIYYLKKKSQKSNLSLDNKNLKWVEISSWNKYISLIHIGHN